MSAATINVIENNHSVTVEGGGTVVVEKKTISVATIGRQGPQGPAGADGSDGADADISQVVPYTGATQDVDLGSQSLRAASIDSTGDVSFGYNLDGLIDTVTKVGVVTAVTYNANNTINTVSNANFTKTFNYNPDSTLAGVTVT